ncbi:hypothetical protein JGUZn3_05950 [Entomobacter blattae]|uniref:Uncharacterized protein n=1 Tax=Entomobacter blattae TaxID=2762277 RepID=A0A7H1NPX7_9PROT|nr:hypothetical protein JGUZn3_05950 [Entomobacter blattae]
MDITCRLDYVISTLTFGDSPIGIFFFGSGGVR